jgi:hypothetical protein
MKDLEYEQECEDQTKGTGAGQSFGGHFNPYRWNQLEAAS